MIFRVIHDLEAMAEFREAVAWYESKAEGLGTCFVLEVDSVMAAISSQPFRFSLAGRKSRKARVLGRPDTI
jgi:hypothetical protein